MPATDAVLLAAFAFQLRAPVFITCRTFYFINLAFQGKNGEASGWSVSYTLQTALLTLQVLRHHPPYHHIVVLTLETGPASC